VNAEAVIKGVNLVWAKGVPQEANWLRYLLRPLIRRELVAERFEIIEADSIYVVSGNRNLHVTIPRSFLNAVSSVPGKGLIHVGDEYFAGGYDVYRSFDFVLRTHHACWFKNVSEVLTFPLGWAEGTPRRSTLKPIESRQYIWSFLGNQAASSRAEMLRALRQIKPQFVHSYDGATKASRQMPASEYHAVLEDTAFAPCPMGNAMLETWRFYESLEAGCIPIIEVRPWMHYHERLLGPHPIPTIYYWSQAESLIQKLCKDPGQLRAMQQRISNWWTECKESNQLTINRFISEKMGKRNGNGSISPIPSTSPLWPMRRMFELLRHQSVMSAYRRARRPFAALASKQR
jgi:hypothetical protein